MKTRLVFSLNFNAAVFNSCRGCIGQRSGGHIAQRQHCSGCKRTNWNCDGDAYRTDFCAGTATCHGHFCNCWKARCCRFNCCWEILPIAREVSDANANVLTTTSSRLEPSRFNEPNPVPAITSLSPNSATAGGAAFTFDIPEQVLSAHQLFGGMAVSERLSLSAQLN